MRENKPQGYSTIYNIQLYIMWTFHIVSQIWRICLQALHEAKYYKTVLFILCLYKFIARILDIILRPIVYLIIIAKWKIDSKFDKLSERQKQLILNLILYIALVVLGYTYFYSYMHYSVNFTPNPNHYLKYLLGLLITITNK